MSRDVDVVGARILAPLSSLLKKPLRVIDGHDADRSDAFTIHLPLAHLSVVSAGGVGPGDIVEVPDGVGRQVVGHGVSPPRPGRASSGHGVEIWDLTSRTYVLHAWPAPVTIESCPG